MMVKTKKVFGFFVLAFLLGIIGQKSDAREMVGQKDGVKLYVSFTESFGADKPIIICEIENSTDTSVVYQLRGSAEGPAFEIHLYDINGVEVSKKGLWKEKYETGDSMHIRFGVITNGGGALEQEINLREVYGDGLNQGVRLEVLWNAGDIRTGPGPFGGVFGAGSGVNGVVDIPWTGNDVNNDPGSFDSLSLQNPEINKGEREIGPGNIRNSDVENEDLLTQRHLQERSWLVLMVIILTVVVGIAAWLLRKRFSR
jgi:hypothetical protein